MNKASIIPEVRTAMNIYDAIPAGLKQSKVNIFNPLSVVSDWGNKIALIWTQTDTDRIIAIGKQVYEEKQNLQDIYKYFAKIYGENLYSLLSKAMKSEDLDKFVNYSASGTSQGGKVVTQNKYIVSKIKTSIRKTTENPSDWKVWEKSNIIETVPYGKLIGMSTGNEVFNETEETTYLGLNIWGSDGMMHKAFVPKTEVDVFDEPALAKRFNKANYADVLQDKALRHTFDVGNINGILSGTFEII